jgi:predicted nucleic acid-binding protein
MKIPDRVLVDASVAIKWVVEEPDSGKAILLLDRQLVAPDLLCAECGNILWKKVAKRELTAEEADLAAQAIERAEIEIVSMRPYLARALALANEYGHPAYDCVYLAVAEGLDLPIVTADTQLVNKLRQSGRPSDRLIQLSQLD